MLVDHLSEAWLAAVDGELEARDRLRVVASRCPLGLTQVVTGAGAGGVDLVYHLTSHGGAVRCGWGAARPEDVRITSDATTTGDIGAGRRNVKEAFITGQVTVVGDQRLLLESNELLAALDDVMAVVAARTRFADA